MKRKLQWTAKTLILLTAGGALLDNGTCLPKNYAANFAANGRNYLLGIFAQTVYTSIAEAILPGSTDIGTNGTN